MRAALLACLLAVAGVNASPEVEVAPAQGRIVDLWLLNVIDDAVRMIREAGLDPAIVERREFEYIIINDLVEVRGFVENLNFVGASDVSVNNLYYNMLFGRLDFDFVLPELNLSVGNYEAQLIYDDIDTTLKVAGSLVMNDIRLRGNALLRLDPGRPTIYNINTDFSIRSIKSDASVDRERDISEGVNDFFNVGIPAFLETNKDVIDTVMADMIRRGVNMWW